MHAVRKLDITKKRPKQGADGDPTPLRPYDDGYISILTNI